MRMFVLHPWLLSGIGLSLSCLAFAEGLPINPPHIDNRGGNIPTHYVRMSGTGEERFVKSIYKEALKLCKASRGTVDSKPSGENFSEVIEDTYYAPNFKISYHNSRLYALDKNCVLQHEWKKTAKLETQAGHCKINFDNKKASGQCMAIIKEIEAPGLIIAGTSLPPRTKRPKESEGFISMIPTVRDAVISAGVVLGHQCIETKSSLGITKMTGCNLPVSDDFLPMGFRHKRFNIRPESSGISIRSRSISGDENPEKMSIFEHDLEATEIKLNITTNPKVFTPHIDGGFNIHDMPAIVPKTSPLRDETQQLDDR
jgi:hypothetical protein